MPQGISCASEVFQRKISELLEGLEGIVIYQDDILVHGSSISEHDQRLTQVMNRLKETGILLNMSKCEIRCNSHVSRETAVQERYLPRH